jgi:hypothetical protein
VLPADENRALQAHLESCTACALEVSTLEQTWNDMALVEDEQPSEALRSTFYARLHEAERGARSGLGARFTAWGARLAGAWPRRPALQMATALATLGVGSGIGLRVRTETVTPPGSVAAPATGAPAVPTPPPLIPGASGATAPAPAPPAPNGSSPAPSHPSVENSMPPSPGLPILGVPVASNSTSDDVHA